MMKSLMLSLVFTLVANYVFGFKQEDINKLIKTGECFACDFSGFDFSGKKIIREVFEKLSQF